MPQRKKPYPEAAYVKAILLIQPPAPFSIFNELDILARKWSKYTDIDIHILIIISVKNDKCYTF